MKTDERDEDVQRLLDDAVRQLEPSPEARFRSIRSSGSRRRAARWTAIGVTIMAVAATVGWAAIQLHDRTDLRRVTTPPPRITTTPTPRWATFEAPDVAVIFQYPPAWHAASFTAECRYEFPIALVSNVNHRFRPLRVQGGCGSPLSVRGLPPSHVLVSVTSLAAVDGSGLDPQNAPLPLDLANAEREKGQPQGIAGETHLSLLVREFQSLYVVDVWFGRTASQGDESIARRIVGSIVF